VINVLYGFCSPVVRTSCKSRPLSSTVHRDALPYMQVGPVADGMVKRGVNLTTVRKLAQGLAFVVPAACMLACAALTPAAGTQAANVPLLVGLLSVGFAFGAWSRAGLYCNHQVRFVNLCEPPCYLARPSWLFG
jgi:hypothetical protein